MRNHLTSHFKHYTVYFLYIISIKFSNRRVQFVNLKFFFFLWEGINSKLTNRKFLWSGYQSDLCTRKGRGGRGLCLGTLNQNMN